MILHNHHGAEFEVTEEMQQILWPLGESTEDPSYEQSVAQLKKLLGNWEIDLPTGFWDCYLDEGHWDYNEETGESMEVPCDCPGGVHKADDVFVRIPMSHSEETLQVFAQGEDVTINGEPYGPQDCVTDLMALLAVFQLFARRGEL